MSQRSDLGPIFFSLYYSNVKKVLENTGWSEILSNSINDSILVKLPEMFLFLGVSTTKQLDSVEENSAILLKCY